MTRKSKTVKRKRPAARPPEDKIIGILKKRLTEIGEIRDRLSDDLEDLETAHGDCVEAYQNIEDAIEALSRLA